MAKLDEFTAAYAVAALWSSTGDDGEPLDSSYTVDDLSPECVAAMVADCAKFQADNAELLARAGDAAKNGHDFWLTRNGHGAGFWDRGYGDVGVRLTAACKTYGEFSLYVGDDGNVHA